MVIHLCAQKSFTALVQGRQCLSLSVKTSAFPYQMWIWCQFTFIPILMALNLLWMVLQHHRSIKSMWYLLHFDVIVPQDLLSSKHFGPAREEKRVSLPFVHSQLSLLPSTGHHIPVEQMREREKMDASLCSLNGQSSPDVGECRH